MKTITKNDLFDLTNNIRLELTIIEEFKNFKQIMDKSKFILEFEDMYNKLNNGDSFEYVNLDKTKTLAIIRKRLNAINNKLDFMNLNYTTTSAKPIEGFNMHVAFQNKTTWLNGNSIFSDEEKNNYFTYVIRNIYPELLCRIEEGEKWQTEFKIHTSLYYTVWLFIEKLFSSFFDDKHFELMINILMDKVNSKIEESGLGGKKRTDRLYWVVNIC